MPLQYCALYRNNYFLFYLFSR